MLKMKIYVVVYLLFLSYLNVSEPNGQGPSVSGHVNLIVILDTSNRISTQEQVDKDQEIVTEIVTEFGKLVRRHFREILHGEPVQYPHRLLFVVPHQPEVDEIPSNIMRQLELKDTGGGYREYVQQEVALLGEIPKVYDFARQRRQTGSDIWGWFEYEAHDYLYEGYQNLIICVSDGYLRFDSNIQRPEGTSMHLIDNRIDMSKPLKSVENGFSDCSVKFLMLEIDMRIDGDFKNMKSFWRTWLNAIGIEKADFAIKGRWLRKLQTHIPGE